VEAFKSLSSEHGGGKWSGTASNTGGGAGKRFGTASSTDTGAAKWSGTVSDAGGGKGSGTASNTGGGNGSGTASKTGGGKGSGTASNTDVRRKGVQNRLQHRWEAERGQILRRRAVFRCESLTVSSKGV